MSFEKSKYSQWYKIKYRILLCASWVHFWARIYFKVIYELQRASILLLKVIYMGSKEPLYYFKSNIPAQKRTQIGSNIRYFILYHWVTHNFKMTYWKKYIGIHFVILICFMYQKFAKECFFFHFFHHLSFINHSSYKINILRICVIQSIFDRNIDLWTDTFLPLWIDDLIICFNVWINLLQ